MKTKRETTTNFKDILDYIKLYIDLIPDAIICVDRQEKYLYINPPAEKMYKKKNHEIVGKKITTVFPQVKNTELYLKIKKAIKKREAITLKEYQTIFRRWSTVHVRHLNDITILYFSDVTNYKELEQQLTTSVKRFLNIVENLEDGYYALDRNWKYTYVNKMGAQLAQTSPDKLIGKQLKDTFPETLTTPFHIAANAAMYKNKPGKVEAYYPPYRRWYENICYPTDEGIAIFARDITYRKQVEEKLTFLINLSRILSSSLDYQATLRSVGQTIVDSLADWCIIYIMHENQKPEIIISSQDTKLRRAIEKYVKKFPSQPGSRTMVAQVMQSGKPLLISSFTEKDIQEMAKNDEHKRALRDLQSVSAMTVPLIVHKQVIGTIVLHSTHTNHLFNPSDLILAQEVADRAAVAIDNARLYTDSQKAVSLRDDFISIASHELKTPITSLKMYTQGLLAKFKDSSESQATRYLEKMDNQINKLTILIEDLLNVSRVQSNRLDFKKESFLLKPLILDMIENIQTSMNHHAILIEGSIRKEVIGDKDRIGQVLINLLTNAIKYSPQADKIIIRLTPSKHFARIIVQDFGIGIDKAHKKKIFDLFYRVSGIEEKTFPGLGIGLYISNEIVKRHGGKMSVKSVKGKGSEFSFTLPYIKK